MISSIVKWDGEHYLKEANKQLSDKNIFKEVEYKEKILTELSFLRTLGLGDVDQKTT